MNKFKGKFGEALKAAKEHQEDKPVKPEKPEKAKISAEKSQSVKKGRPLGKRSNPDFEQVTAYIRSQTYRQTKIALLMQNELSDFSELVEELLIEWLSTQKGES